MQAAALPESTRAIGGYWTRTNYPQIDIVCADREPVARRITAVGSAKWQDHRRFDRHDLTELIVQRSMLPGADASTPLVVVARAGVDLIDVTDVTVFTPGDLLEAWR